MNLPELDVLSFLSWSILFAVISGLIAFFRGFQLIRASRSQPFFRRRRMMLVRGWRVLFVGLILLGISLILSIAGEPFAYAVYPITPTPSLSPMPTQSLTITPTPSKTLSPTPTLTPAESYTPTITPTPFMPLAIEAQFEAFVTPNPDAVFSPFVFAKDIDSLFRPVRPDTVFQNPVGQILAVFSYDKMIDGSQWTALWYRDGELIHYESLVWNGGTGGLGFSEWRPDAEAWSPGNYQVQIFVGLELKVVGDFIVEGAPVTSTPTVTKTNTITLTPTITLTNTIGPSLTPTPIPPTQTPYPTLTRTPVTPSQTPYSTLTRTPVTPSQTPYPTLTRTPTPD